jgi:hypothetical protein
MLSPTPRWLRIFGAGNRLKLINLPCWDIAMIQIKRHLGSGEGAALTRLLRYFHNLPADFP